MARKKKVAAKRDVRGYQQGPSKQQQPAAAAAVVSRSASSLGTASDAAVRAVPLTASTQQDLETLLETLLHINNASNNQGDSSSTLATAPQAVQSDRFFKRMATVYDRLTQLGFTLDQIVQAVVALGYEITLESALDWLCLHLSTQELPPLFTEGQIRESETAASSGMADPLTVLPATARPVSIDAQQEHVLLTTDFATNPQFQSAKESASANLQEKDEDDKAAQKTWLLQQYEYVADDEQDIGLNDVIRDEMDTANATTRRKERSLATPLATLEPAVDAAAINESSANAVDNVADPVTVAEPTVQEMQLQALQEELRQLEADLKDEAALYMLSKYEVKELQKRTKNLRKQVQGMQRKVEKQRVQSRQNQVAVLSKVVSMDQVDDAADEGEEVETGGMSSMFEEEQAPQEPLQPATNDTTLQDADDGNAVDIPKDSIPKSWTGKTPREILQDWCRKQKLQRPMYQKLSRNGCSIRVKLGPSNIVYLEQRGPYPSYVDTQEYMATKALFDINPDLPLYRIFPPFHRDIWRTWVDSNKQEKDNKAQEGKDQRSETIDMLIKSIPVAQASSIKPSSNTAISRTGMSKARDEAEEELDSWEGHDERLEPESWEDNDDTGDDRLLSQERERAPTAVDERLRKSFLARQLTAGYKDMLQLRSSLPMYLYREEILGCIRKNPVTILYAETGAGKTTQCPQFVLEQALLDGKGSHTSILCTQPRRVAAMSVAERVADEMCEESIGKLVGYQIRLEARRSSATRLLFCTTGIILRRLVEDPELRGISHVVVDEVHERQWQIDVLLVALRNLLNGARPDLKVVLMSATLDSKLFTKFFNGAPLISVPGRTFPVTQYYLEDLLDAADHIIEEGSRCARRQRDNRETASLFVSTRGGEKRRETVSLDSELDTDLSDEFVGYKMATRRSMDRVDETNINYDLIEDILRLILVNYDKECGLVPPENADLSHGAVLVFMPGKGEIITLTERLKGSRLFRKEQFEIVPLHSTLSSGAQRLAFMPARPGCRKIIISTNIAETSVTIPDVVCVLDSGRVREIQRDKRTSTSKLMMEWCSRASTKQRAGRAGRVQPGLCLKLFSSRTEKYHMKTATEPELRRIPLEEVCLNILAAGFAKSCMEFLRQTPEPPTEDAVRAALSVLREIGAVSSANASQDSPGATGTTTDDLTPLGQHLAKLPVDARVGKMLIFGALFRCIDTIATIAASLSASQSIFVSSLYESPEARAARLSFADPRSDFLTFVNIWEAYRKCSSPSEARKLCKERSLNNRALREIGDARSLYLDLLSGLGFLDRKKLGYDDRSREYKDKLLVSSIYNVHGRKEEVVHAVVCGGTYPNLAHCHTGTGGDRSLWHKQERLFVHSSSVNFKTPTYLPSSWIAFHEKFGTSSRVTVSTTCFVHPFSLMIFGGTIVVKHTERKVCLDEWIELGMAAKTGVMFRELRKEVDCLLEAVFEDTDSATNKSARNAEATKMIDGIVQLLVANSVRQK